MIKEKNFRQLIFGFTTDNRTIIDHLYTDLIIEEKIYACTLESYFSDHKAIWASLKEFQQGKPLCNFHSASTNQIQSKINFLT